MHYPQIFSVTSLAKFFNEFMPAFSIDSKSDPISSDIFFEKIFLFEYVSLIIRDPDECTKFG